MANYPISNVSRRVVYTGSAGVGPYAFTFEIINSGDVDVYKNDTLLTLTTNYTVTINSNGTGSVTLVVAATGSDRITIVGARAIERTTDFVTGGDLFANTLNEEIDSQTIFVQQVAETAERSIKAPVTDPTNINMTLPSQTSRAGKILAFDASGNPTIGDDVGNWRGDWATATTYGVRDMVRDASNYNVYRCKTAHISTGSTPISSNVDVAKWDLILDVAIVGTNAQISADWAKKTNGIVESTDYSSKAYAIGGTGVTDTAGRGAAKEWATKTGGTVDGTEYSAKYYSQTASTFATNSSNSASAASTSATNASNSASAASTSATNASNSATASATSATNSSNSATSSSTSATNAANSAALAAAYAASGLYSSVIDKSANYTVVIGDAGALIRVTTTSGAIAITLPAISTVPDGFKVAVVKWTGDSNAVTISRAGSDTINGATSVSISTQYSSTTFVADLESGQWFASSTGIGATNVNVQAFSGDGTTVAFTMSSDAGTENNTQVFVSGIYQEKDTYSLSGTTLTFSTAPPTGTGNIEVVWSTPLAIGTPSDGTVTTAKIVDQNVTTAKIADANVTAVKLASGAAVSNIGYTPANDSLVMHLAGAETATGAKRGAVVPLTDGANIATDLALGNNFSVTLAGNRTLDNPTNLVAGQSGVIKITQDATGSRTLAYGSYWDFAGGTAPTLTTTANGVDILAYYVDSSTNITTRFIGDRR